MGTNGKTLGHNIQDQQSKIVSGWTTERIFQITT
jgi:hypothetical protein